MKIINWKNKEAVETAVKVINSGGILVYPTDTIYGFGVNAKDPIAIDKLNVLKNRVELRPLKIETFCFVRFANTVSKPSCAFK